MEFGHINMCATKHTSSWEPITQDLTLQVWPILMNY